MLTLSDISKSGGLSRWSCDKGREGPDEASSLAMKGPTQMTCDLVKESAPGHTEASSLPVRQRFKTHIMVLQFLRFPSLLKKKTACLAHERHWV